MSGKRSRPPVARPPALRGRLDARSCLYPASFGRPEPHAARNVWVIVRFVRFVRVFRAACAQTCPLFETSAKVGDRGRPCPSRPPRRSPRCHPSKWPGGPAVQTPYPLAAGPGCAGRAAAPLAGCGSSGCRAGGRPPCNPLATIAATVRYASSPTVRNSYVPDHARVRERSITAISRRALSVSSGTL